MLAADLSTTMPVKSCRDKFLHVSALKRIQMGGTRSRHEVIRIAFLRSMNIARQRSECQPKSQEKGAVYLV